MPLPSRFFPFQANMDRPIVERYGYRSDVITAARDRSEQRMYLRARPRGTIAFHASQFAERDAQIANAILFAGQADAIGVPMWHYSEALTANAVATDTVINVATTTANLFAVGYYAIIWSSPTNFHAGTITAVGASSVTMTAVAAGLSFTAGQSWIMPLLPCRFRPIVPYDWHSLAVGSVQLDFDVDEFPLTASTLTLPTYKTIDVLDERTFNPNRDEDVTDSLAHNFAVLDNVSGIRSSEELSTEGVSSLSFKWLCTTRAQVKALRDFLDRCKGRTARFLIPSFQRDLPLASDVANGATLIYIPDTIDYNGRYFAGVDTNRTYLRFFRKPVQGAVTPFYTRVQSVAVVGSNHELTIDENANTDYAASSTIVSFVKASRLAEDEQEIVFYAPTVAQCELHTIETPKEYA